MLNYLFRTVRTNKDFFVVSVQASSKNDSNICSLLKSNFIEHYCSFNSF